MSIVKYFNKKLNRFLIYEYSSSKDPVTQKRKVTRKYLGSEDAVSHILPLLQEKEEDHLKKLNILGLRNKLIKILRKYMHHYVQKSKN